MLTLNFSYAQKYNASYYRVNIPVSVLKNFTVTEGTAFAWDVVDSDTLVIRRLKI